MAKKKAKVKEKYTIVLPKMFGDREIGITFAAEPSQVIGREIVVNALELVENTNKYYLKITFKISRVEGNKAFAEFHGTECLQDYISRMVVRRVRRVDTVQDLMTRDKVKLRVKSICTISRKAKSSVQKTLANKIKEMMKQEVEEKTLDEFVRTLISDEIKIKILTEAKKIYPIKNFEIRKVEVLYTKGKEQ